MNIRPQATRGQRAVVFALLLCGGLSVGCKEEPRPDSSPAPAEPEAPAAPGAPVQDPTANAADEEPSAEQLPLPADFEPQVEQEITADNFRVALDTLEKEILADSSRR